MKTLVRFFALAAFVVATPVIQTGCHTAPDSRVAAGHTLKAVGATAETAVAVSATLFRDGKITAAQARQVLDFFDGTFQPIFRLAVITARSDLSTPANPDVIRLAGELATLVASFKKP